MLILSSDSRDLIFEFLKGVDAEVQASTPCLLASMHSCANCRALVNTIVCRRLQVAAGCMQEVAACMQASCRLHAACIRSYAGGCRLQHPACRRLQGCSRLHAACMQPACISSGALALSVIV